MSDFGLFLQFCLVISVSTMCEAVAKHDFNGKDDSELSFKKSSVMKILRTSKHEGWYIAEVEGREGMIPANYVQFKPKDFMAPKVTRHGAEELLLKQHDGAFLIREAEHTQGDFALSVKFRDGVQHFKVLRDGCGKYFLWVVKFNSLNTLVNYHRTASVSRSQQILLKDRKTEAIYVALYDFTAAEEGELSFKKGDMIMVNNKGDPNWWTGRLVATGVEGMFPRTYINEITE